MDFSRIKNNKNGFYYYQTDDFVTIKLEFDFLIGSTKEDYFKALLLSSYLNKTNSKYLRMKEISDKKKDLYALELKIGIKTIGIKIFLSFRVDMINPKVVDDEYFNDAIDFLKIMMLEPNFKNGKLDKDIFNQIKNEIINNESNVLKDSSKMQARLFRKNTLPESILNNRFCLDIEELKNIINSFSDKDIIDFYNKTMNSFYAGFAFGNLTDEQNNYLINKLNFKAIVIDNNYCVEDIISTGEKEIVSKDTTQSYLYVVYEIKDYEIKKSYIYRTICGMLNSMSGSLMQILREKLGIVYSVSANIFYYNGFMYVLAQIDKKNKDKALKGIEEAFNKIISDEYCNQYFVASKKRLEELYISQSEDINYNFEDFQKYVLGNNYTGEEQIKLIRRLTSDDIQRELKNIEKKYVFYYKGDK